MSILLCDDELEALYGLPMLAFRAYVAAIRPRMDVRTGLVGRIARISYQALIEWCYIEPVPGVPRESISRDQMARAVRCLERAGLISIRSDKVQKILVFHCEKAQLLSHVKNQAAPWPHAKSAAYLSNEINSLMDEAAQVENTQAAQHRREVYTSPSVAASSSSTTVVGSRPPEGGQWEPPTNRPPQGGAEGPHGHGATDGTQNELFPAQRPEKASIEGDGLSWPPSLDEHQRGAIAAKLRRLEEGRHQLVIDELAGFMARPSKPVGNPVRYVDYIIQKAALPVWFPEYAGKVRAAREQAKKLVNQVVSPPQGPRTPPPPGFFDKAGNILRGRDV